jgi:hypothetical protein
MPVQVTVYRWGSADASMPLNETAWTMFELPAAGDRYWHGSDGFVVREIDDSQDPPHVHLNHDSEWVRAVNDQLPEGYMLDGGRDSHTGRWHFHAVTPEHGRPVGDGYSENINEAMQQALGHAAEHHQSQASES